MIFVRLDAVDLDDVAITCEKLAHVDAVRGVDQTWLQGAVAAVSGDHDASDNIEPKRRHVVAGTGDGSKVGVRWWAETAEIRDDEVVLAHLFPGLGSQKDEMAV